MLCYILVIISITYSSSYRWSGLNIFKIVSPNTKTFATPGGGEFKTSAEVADLRNEALTKFLGKVVTITMNNLLI